MTLKKIRVTETRVYEYVLDPNEDAYLIGVEGINDGKPALTIEQMIEVDKYYYNEGQLDLGDYCDRLPEVTTVWEAVDDDY